MANIKRDTNDPDELANEYRALGVPEEQIEAYFESRQQEGRECFFVWEENKPSLDLFFAVAGSWSRFGMDGRPAGLDETAIFIRMQVMGKDRDLDLYDDVIAMGLKAAEEITERFYQ